MSAARSLGAAVLALVVVGVGLITLTGGDGAEVEPTPTVAASGATSTLSGASAPSPTATVTETGTAGGAGIATPEAVNVPGGGDLGGVQPLPFAQHADYRGYEREELAAAGFVDTGAFIAVPFNPAPVTRASYRAGFTAIEVAAAGYVDLDGERWHRGLPPGAAWSSTSAVGLTATVAGVPLYATFSSEWGVTGSRGGGSRLLPTGGGELGFYAADDSAPVMMLQVKTADGEFVPAITDTRGRLWVRLAPVEDGPIAEDTGELLDVGGVSVFGPVPKGLGNWRNLTWCEGGEACIAILHVHDGGGLPAVTDGVASCSEGAEGLTVELRTDVFTLTFERTTGASASVGGCDGAFPRAVTAGEVLSRYPSWLVDAVDANGAALGVASDAGRMLYVGVERTIATCPPCFTGS